MSVRSPLTSRYSSESSVEETEKRREHYEFFKERGQKNGGRRAVLFAGHQLAPFPRAAHFLLRRFTVTKGQGEG